MLEGAVALAEEVHAAQSSRHQRPLVAQRQARHEVMTQRCDVGRVGVVRHLARLVVQAEQSVIGSHPCAVAAPHEVRDVIPVQRLQHLVHLALHQPSALCPQFIQSAVDGCPHLAVAVHIAQPDARGVAAVRHVQHPRYVAIAVKLYIIYICTRDKPHRALAVREDTHRSHSQHAVKAFVAARSNLLHRVQRHHVSTLLVTYPEPLELVFGHIEARVAHRREPHVISHRRKERVTVITRYAAADCGHPYEAVAVGEDIRHVIAGHARAHVHPVQDILVQ